MSATDEWTEIGVLVIVFAQAGVSSECTETARQHLIKAGSAILLGRRKETKRVEWQRVGSLAGHERRTWNDCLQLLPEGDARGGRSKVKRVIAVNPADVVRKLADRAVTSLRAGGDGGGRDAGLTDTETEAALVGKLRSTDF